jgi:hypothetical protein
MTHNAALNLAIKILRRWAVDYYGRDAKHKPEQKHEYDRIYEAISILEALKERIEK